ncbi:MAG TPA: response regulator [Nitrospirae bacterium]|nr:response regulator [Nitrospirota bacterium]
MDKAKLLIVDDEEIALKSLEKAMKKEGYNVTTTYSGPNALKFLDAQEFDVVLTDLKMVKVDGMEILRRCRRLYPDSEVVMITGFASLDGAVDAMKKGAYHYIAKPIKLDEMRQVVKEALEKIKLKKENTSLREQIEGTFRNKKDRIPSLEELEMDYIRWVLKDVGGNKTQAAQILEIDRVSLWRKLKKYGLETEKNADQ